MCNFPGTIHWALNCESISYGPPLSHCSSKSVQIRAMKCRGNNDSLRIFLCHSVCLNQCWNFLLGTNCAYIILIFYLLITISISYNRKWFNNKKCFAWPLQAKTVGKILFPIRSFLFSIVIITSCLYTRELVKHCVFPHFH